jgi:hypothetical protein
MADEDPITRRIPNDYSFYRRLDPSQRQIRLLRVSRLFRGATASKMIGRRFHRLGICVRLQIRSNQDRKLGLACHLFTTNLYDAPPYKALSYCWGSLEDTEPITVVSHGVFMDASFDQELPDRLSNNDHGAYDRHFALDFKVTTNLFSVLDALCLDKSFFWIDMLCIYPIRSRFSCRRFWRHLPPFLAAFISTFLSESVNLCSRSHHVECSILVSDFLTVVYKRLRGAERSSSRI